MPISSISEQNLDGSEKPVPAATLRRLRRRRRSSRRSAAALLQTAATDEKRALRRSRVVLHGGMSGAVVTENFGKFSHYNYNQDWTGLFGSAGYPVSGKKKAGYPESGKKN